MVRGIVDEVRNDLLAAGIYTDADAFDDDLAHIATYAAMYMFTWLPIDRRVAEDPPWVGAWRVAASIAVDRARAACEPRDRRQRSRRSPIGSSQLERCIVARVAGER